MRVVSETLYEILKKKQRQTKNKSINQSQQCDLREVQASLR